jgi:hypothetical protein
MKEFFFFMRASALFLFCEQAEKISFASDDYFGVSLEIK